MERPPSSLISSIKSNTIHDAVPTERCPAFKCCSWPLIVGVYVESCRSVSCPCMKMDGPPWVYLGMKVGLIRLRKICNVCHKHIWSHSPTAELFATWPWPTQLTHVKDGHLHSCMLRETTEMCPKDSKYQCKKDILSSQYSQILINFTLVGRPLQSWSSTTTKWRTITEYIRTS